MFSTRFVRPLYRSSVALLATTIVGACSRAHAAPTPKPVAKPVVKPVTGGPPSTFQQTTSDARIGRVVDVREGLSKVAAFRIATDVLNDIASVDVSDQHAGFLMTPWQATLVRNGVPDLRYRTRIVLRFLGEDWSQMSVRAEANWQDGDAWDVGVDTKLLDRVANELHEKLGAR